MGAPPGEPAVDITPRSGAENLAGHVMTNGHQPAPLLLHGVDQAAVDSRYLRLRGELLDLKALRNIPPPEPLVDGYLFLDSLAWLGGKPAHGKTFVAVELACCIGTGTPWHGHIVAQRPVLYLIAEGASGLASRVDAWALANGRIPENVIFLPFAVKMMENLDVAAFGQLLSEIQPGLVILDTQARVTVGAEENSSRDMGQFVHNLDLLRQLSGACVLVVHHEPRNADNLRGSTALEGAAASILRANKDGNVVTVENSKQKDAPAQPPIALALIAIGDSAVLSHEAVGLFSQTTESEHHVLTVLRDSFGTAGGTKTELKEAANLAKTTWFRTIKALVDKGLVWERKEGRSTIYSLPDAKPEELVP